VGGKTLSLGYKDELLGIIYVENQYPTMVARGIGALGGSLFNLIICSIVVLFSRKSKISYGLILNLLAESIMWSLSLLLQKGDAWNFIQAFHINYLLILIPMIIITVFIYIISMKIMFQTLDRMKGY